MAVTTKKLFPATSNATTTVFDNVGIQLNNQDDLDVYVTLSGGTRVLQLRQSTGSTAQSTHPQVNNTDGLYFPAVTAGTTLYNYTLSTDNNTITFNSALPQDAVVFCERRTRDADSTYTTFASGSTIRATDLNNSSTESNFTAQDGRNKALTIEGVLFRGDQASTNFVTTDHIVNGTIVEADIANSAVTSNKIADNAVTTTEILNGAVTRAKLEADIIDGTKLADNAVNSEHYTDGSIDREHLAADIVDGTKIADDVINSEHYVAGSIDHEHLANDIIDGDNIQDDVVNSEHIAAGALDNEHYAAGSITSDKLSGATVVTNSEQSGYSVNDTSFFTTSAAEARYFNASTGETIKDGETFPDNDTTIATTAAINDRIIDLVEEVGGFVPIANETSFPATNPDINLSGSAKGGTIVSVQAASTALTAQSGTTLTIANGRGTGNAVIITGVSATIPQGFGFLVETTQTDHTYAFHRLVPKATEVTTVAGKATEIGRLGTAAAVEDMSILGTTDVVADMAILGTADVVSDMNTLGTADVVADMNTLAVTSVINDMDTVATNVTNVNNVGGSIANVNTTAGSIANVNTVAGSISNVNTVGGAISNVNNVGGSITNVNTVATNLASVNNFANQYRIGSSNPTTSLDTGDLFFNTTSNSLKVYTGSAWVDGVTTTGDFALKTGNTFTGSNIYNDNVKALFGTGSDLEIYHDGSNSYIKNTFATGDLILDSAQNFYIKHSGEVQIQAVNDGAVNLYYDNSKKFETESTGVHVTGNVSITGDYLADDNEKLKMGDGHDFLIYHDGSANYIKGTNDQFLYFATNDTTRWSIANDGHLRPQANQTYDIGSSVQQVKQAYAKEFIVRDDGYFKAGNLADLQIYHDGSHSYVSASGTGALKLLGNNNDDVQIQPRSGYNSARFKPNGAVELYYDNGKRIETTTYGITVTGNSNNPTTDSWDTNSSIITSGSYGGGIAMIDGSAGFVQSLDGSGANYYLRNATTTSTPETSIKAVTNGAVELYYDNTKKFETTSTGAKVSSATHSKLHITSADNNSGMINLGPSSNDDSAQIWYDDYANGMFVRTTTNTPITLYTNNTQRLVLQNDGHLRPYADSSYDLGLTGTRWRNVYADTYYGDGSNLTGINTDLVSDTSPQLGGNLDCNGKNIVFGDSSDGSSDDVLSFGASGDLKIFHQADQSRIVESGPSVLKIMGTDVRLSNAGNTADYIQGNDGSDVKLFFNGSEKFATTVSGAKVLGHLYLDDDYRLRLGTDDDLNIYHNNSANTNEFTSPLSTNFRGKNLYFYTNHNNSSESAIMAYANAQTELYYDNSKKFETTSNGAIVTGSLGVDELYMGDSEKIKIGANDDLQIHHSSNASIIEDTYGDLRIHSNSVRLQSYTGGEKYFDATVNGDVELYYDNNQKLKTVSNGVQVNGYLEGMSGDHLTFNTASAHNIRFRTNGTLRFSLDTSGHLVPYANNTYDLGTSSYRFRNIYTNDLHLSNKGSSNDVDSTWGDWTIQEGESDLFLKNNRSGKKYKFNLTEVS